MPAQPEETTDHATGDPLVALLGGALERNDATTREGFATLGAEIRGQGDRMERLARYGLGLLLVALMLVAATNGIGASVSMPGLHVSTHDAEAAIDEPSEAAAEDDGSEAFGVEEKEAHAVEAPQEPGQP